MSFLVTRSHSHDEESGHTSHLGCIVDGLKGVIVLAALAFGVGDSSAAFLVSEEKEQPTNLNSC